MTPDSLSGADEAASSMRVMMPKVVGESIDK